MKVHFFAALFAARTDIYATRWENVRAGKAGWLPVVRGGWRKGVRHEDRDYLPLKKDVLRAHLTGEVHVGLYPLLDGDLCWWLAADFDGPMAMLLFPANAVGASRARAGASSGSGSTMARSTASGSEHHPFSAATRRSRNRDGAGSRGIAPAHRKSRFWTITGHALIISPTHRSPAESSAGLTLAAVNISNLRSNRARRAMWLTRGDFRGNALHGRSRDTTIGVAVIGRRRAHTVEVDSSGLMWIKSSASGSSGTGCVEAAESHDHVVVRCSRNRSGQRLFAPAPAWHEFVRWVASNH